MADGGMFTLQHDHGEVEQDEAHNCLLQVPRRRPFMAIRVLEVFGSGAHVGGGAM